MGSSGIDNLAIARKYLEAIEQGPSGRSTEFFCDDVVQEEFPNRLVPHGAVRNLQQLREAALRGHMAVGSQRFEILNAVENGAQLALEVRWTAVVNVPIGSIPAGGQMRARFAVFLQFRDGKIARQRNYDCFGPF